MSQKPPPSDARNPGGNDPKPGGQPRPDSQPGRSRDSAGDPTDRRAAKDANRSGSGAPGPGHPSGGLGTPSSGAPSGRQPTAGATSSRSSGAAGGSTPGASSPGKGGTAKKGPGGAAREKLEQETGGKGKAGKGLDKGLKAAKKVDPTGTAQAADAAVRVARVVKRRVLPAVAALLFLALAGSSLVQPMDDATTSGVEGAGTEVFEARLGEAARPLIKAWRTAATRTGKIEEGGVPWTVLAAVAIAATEAGRFSPYDQCDRATERGDSIVKPRPVSDTACDDPAAWPSASPAIGDPAKAQALGPYLLRPGSIPDGVDPQDLRARSSGPDDTPETATDYVAKRLWELRRDLTNEGWSFTDPTLVQSSWAEAVRRLGIASPNESQDCATPWIEPTDSQDVVLRAVDVTWRCELQRMPIYTLGSGSLSPIDTELEPDQAVDVVVDEAVGVAWAHLQATSTTVCNPTGPGPQGVFPLTAEIYAEFSPDVTRDRCDKGASIHAAARAFVAVERLEPGVRHADDPLRDRSDETGKFKPSIGGWAAMPWVFGTEYAEVLTNGPLSVEATSFKPTAECQTAIDAWADRVATALAAQPEGTFAYDQYTTATSAVIAGAIATDPRPDASCPTTLRTQRSYAGWIATTLAARADVLYRAAGGQYPEPRTGDQTTGDATTPSSQPATTTSSTTTTTVPYAALAPSLALFALADWANANVAGTPTVTPVTITPGVNTLIARLNPSGASLEGVPAIPASSSTPPYIARVTQLASAIGGLYPGDPLSATTDPFQVLATPSFTTVSGTTCLPVPIAAAVDKAMATWAQRVPAPFNTSRFGADILIEQLSTESQSQWNRVAADGSTGVTIAAEGQLADTGPYDASAYPRTPRGILGARYGARDTDAGRIDGLTDADVAVGVTQFIPSTWTSYAALYDLDGNGDGVEDPHNAFDAVLATAIYYSRLASGKDLSVDLTAREAAIAQYGGFKVGSTSFAAYLKTRSDVSRQSLDCLSQYATVTLTPPQTTVGPDGCVTSIPQGIMRDGSIELDVAALCAEAVSQAATPEAALALKYVFANIHGTYSKSDRMDVGKYDCSSLVMRAYQEPTGAGLFRMYDNWAPPSHAMAPHSGWKLLPYLLAVAPDALRPGDLLVRSPPTGGHVMMVLIPGKWIIHQGGPTGAMGYVQKWPKDFATLAYRRVNPIGLK